MNEEIDIVLRLAFEAGRWQGQVDLEEYYDREQFATVIQEVIVSRKTSMPEKSASTGRTVTINLRSDAWREGVKKSSEEYIEKAKMYLIAILNTKKRYEKPSVIDDRDIFNFEGK